MAKPKKIVPVEHDTEFMHFMLYGPPGVGKTVLAGTSPKALILDCDGGTGSAKIHGSKAEKWRVRDWSDMDEAYEYMANEGHKEYEWVWIDTVTQMQENGLDHIMRDLVAAKPHRRMDQPDKGEYGQNMNRLKQYVRGFKALPINVGLTAYSFEAEDPDSGETMFYPMVTGKNMAHIVCGQMNVVGYLYLEKGERRLRLQRSETVYAKDTFEITKTGVMANPTVPKLLKGIAANFSNSGSAPAEPVRAARPKTARRSA